MPSKSNGTTPHGHRHSYAQMLTDAAIGAEVIQAALHHKSLESQQVYKEPTADKVNSTLRHASEKIDSVQSKIFGKGLDL